MSSRPALAAALLILAACDREPPRGADALPETDALAGVELAPSTSKLPIDPQLPVVVVGPAAPAGSPRGGERVHALAVDRRASSGQAEQALREILAAGSEAVELRVGSTGAASAIRICLTGSRAASEGPDCWGRTVTRPATADAGAAPAPDADAPTNGDLVDRPPAFDWSAPIALELSIEPDFFVVRMQGRVVRTLATGAGPAAGGASAPGPRSTELGQTLETPRRRNGWDRRVAVSVAGGVAWERVVEILDVLVEYDFDQIALVGVAAEPRT